MERERALDKHVEHKQHMKCWLGSGKAGIVLNLASVVMGKLLMFIGELLSPLPSEK